MQRLSFQRSSTNNIKTVYQRLQNNILLRVTNNQLIISNDLSTLTITKIVSTKSVMYEKVHVLMTLHYLSNVYSTTLLQKSKTRKFICAPETEKMCNKKDLTHINPIMYFNIQTQNIKFDDCNITLSPHFITCQQNNVIAQVALNNNTFLSSWKTEYFNAMQTIKVSLFYPQNIICIKHLTNTSLDYQEIKYASDWANITMSKANRLYSVNLQQSAKNTSEQITLQNIFKLFEQFTC